MYTGLKSLILTQSDIYTKYAFSNFQYRAIWLLFESGCGCSFRLRVVIEAVNGFGERIYLGKNIINTFFP